MQTQSEVSSSPPHHHTGLWVLRGHRWLVPATNYSMTQSSLALAWCACTYYAGHTWFTGYPTERTRSAISTNRLVQQFVFAIIRLVCFNFKERYIRDCYFTKEREIERERERGGGGGRERNREREREGGGGRERNRERERQLQCV